MKVSRRQFIKIVAASGLAVGLGTSLTRRLSLSGELARVEETRGAIGTYIRLVLLTPDRSSAQTAIDATFDRIAQLEQLLSHHRSASVLSQLNAQGQLLSPPVEFLEVLQQARRVYDWTNGAFDVTIQPVVQLFEDHRQWDALPSTAEVQSALKTVGFQHVTFDAGQVAFQRPGMSITLDGIAKGYIVDAALAVLKRNGYPQAMVDAGGDIASQRDDGADWNLAIQDPRRSQGDLIAVTRLARGALATSGDYLHAYTPDYRLYHILDPRTGLSPLELSSASIVAPNACQADALATSAMVLGAAASLKLVAGLPDVECLLVTKTNQVIPSAGFPIAS